MAITPRSGGDGTFALLAFQDNFRDRKTAAADYIKLSFTPTTLRTNPTIEQTRSATIVRGGSDTPNTPSRIGGDVYWEGEQTPELIPYITIAQFNPDPTPTSAAVASSTITASGTIAADTELITEAVKTANNDTPDASGTDPAFPGKVVLTLGSAITGGGTMTVEGYLQTQADQEDREFETEEIAFSATDTKVSTKFKYAQVKSVKVSKAGTGGLTFEPEKFKTVVQINMSSAQSPGISMQAYNAGVPVAVFGYISNLLEWRFQDEIRMAMTGTASYIRPYRLVSDTEEIAYAAPTTGDFALTNFPEPELNYMPGWGRALTLGDNTEPVTLDGLTVSINHNYEQPTGSTGRRSAGQPRVGGDGVRQVTFEIDKPFESGTSSDADVAALQRWHDFAIKNQTFKLRMRNYNLLSDGDMFVVQLDMPRCQLTEYPGLDIGGTGEVSQRIAGKCVKSDGATRPDEITVTVWHNTAIAIP